MRDKIGRDLEIFTSYGRENFLRVKNIIGIIYIELIFMLPNIFLDFRMNVKNIILSFIMIISLIIKLYCFIYRKKNYIIFLFYGSCSLFLSILILFDATQLARVSGIYEKWMSITMVGIYICIFTVYMFVYIRLMKKGIDTNRRTVGKTYGAMTFMGTSVLGIMIAKTVLRNQTQDAALLFMTFLSFILSVLFMLGIPNLLKYMCALVFEKKYKID